jgi:heme-degrading monooxygenase HmoA
MNSRASQYPCLPFGQFLIDITGEEEPLWPVKGLQRPEVRNFIVERARLQIRGKEKESNMTVKIVIKRTVPRDKEKELLPLIKQLRILTTRQEGYISGETLQRIDKPGETVVVSTWETVEDWNRWVKSPDRARLQNKIDGLLGKATKYKIYSYN